METDDDGDLPEGMLDRDVRGRFAEVTLRLPAAFLPRVEALLAEAYADEHALGRAEVERLLAEHSDRLRAMGVRRLLVCGEVARGTATPSSDVHVAYEAELGGEHPRDFWSGLLDFLEEVIGKVVTLPSVDILYRPDAAEAVGLWEA